MSRTTRRQFLRSTGLAAGGLMLGPAIIHAQQAKNLRVAHIAVGGRAGYLFWRGCNHTALCDPNKHALGKAAKKYSDAIAVTDYRKLFENGKHKEFDAVVVGTPDHHHYPAAMLALQHGKHVYCEKPLTWSVEEAHRLRLEAKKQGVATQMGNHGHANIGWRMLDVMVKDGLIGDITEVHTWTDRPRWPQGCGRPIPGKSGGAFTSPDWLDWDVWVGPAPMRPYHHPKENYKGRGTYCPFTWRGWYDFGAGAMGDMACHTYDGMFWVQGADWPVSVEPIIVVDHNSETYPTQCKIKYTFAANDKRPGFVSYWYEGGLKPEKPAAMDRDLTKTGNLFIGTRGIIFMSGDYGDPPRLVPESRMLEMREHIKLNLMPKIIKSPGHSKEFILAATGKESPDFPKSNFDYAGPMTEVIQLGNVAMRVNKKLTFDAKARKITNIVSANQYLDREYRSGWKVM